MDMESIPVRQLNQDTAGVLARVERGESLEITSEGVRSPGWFRRPLASWTSWPTSIAAGRAVPATISAPFGLPDGRSTTARRRASCCPHCGTKSAGDLPRQFGDRKMIRVETESPGAVDWLNRAPPSRR